MKDVAFARALGASLANLTEKAAQLNLASDLLTERLEEAEDRIAATSVGIRVVIPVPKSDPPLLFGYGRFKGRWCLLVGSEESQLVPAVDASRSNRITVWTNLPKLIEALAAEAERLHTLIPQEVR